MKRYLVSVLYVGLLSTSWIATNAFAQANNANAQAHLAAARALAYEPGHDYTGSFEVTSGPFLRPLRQLSIFRRNTSTRIA